MWAVQVLVAVVQAVVAVRQLATKPSVHHYHIPHRSSHHRSHNSPHRWEEEAVYVFYDFSSFSCVHAVSDLSLPGEGSIHRKSLQMGIVISSHRLADQRLDRFGIHLELLPRVAFQYHQSHLAIQHQLEYPGPGSYLRLRE